MCLVLLVGNRTSASGSKLICSCLSWWPFIRLIFPFGLSCHSLPFPPASSPLPPRITSRLAPFCRGPVSFARDVPPSWPLSSSLGPARTSVEPHLGILRLHAVCCMVCGTRNAIRALAYSVVQGALSSFKSPRLAGSLDGSNGLPRGSRINVPLFPYFEAPQYRFPRVEAS